MNAATIFGSLRSGDRLAVERLEVRGVDVFVLTIGPDDDEDPRAVVASMSVAADTPIDKTVDAIRGLASMRHERIGDLDPDDTKPIDVQ